jgi:hypothetical protein
MQHPDLLLLFCNIHKKHLQHPDKTSETLETFFCNMRFQRAMSPCCLDKSQSSTPPWRMELGGAPLGEDLLGGLGEHLLLALGQRRTGLARRGMEAPRGMAVAARQSGLAGSAPWALSLRGGRVSLGWASGWVLEASGKRIGTSTWTSWFFYLETEERRVLGWCRMAHQRCVRPPGRPLPSISDVFKKREVM